MIVADILMWFLLIVGILIVFISYWLAAYALFPAMVGRARDTYARPVRNILLGALVAVPLIALGGMISSAPNPALKILGLSVVAVPVLLGLMGSSGLSQRIGGGLASPIDDTQPWRRVLRGGIVLALGFLLPLLGWFGLLPLTILSGVGAFVVTFRSAQPTQPPPLPAPSTPVVEPSLTGAKAANG